MDPLEGTLYGRLSTDLTSELTLFNPGIRLRKGKQSAFFRVSHCRCRGVEQRGAVPGLTFCQAATAVRYEKPPSFSTLLERQIAITAT